MPDRETLSMLATILRMLWRSGEMTYKTHDPARQVTSVYYQQGVKDGAEDRERAHHEPPIPEIGPAEEMNHSWMYRQGYMTGRSE